MLTNYNLIKSIKYKSLVGEGVEISEGSKIKFSQINGNVNVGSNTSLYRVNVSGEVNIGRYTSINGSNTNIYSLLEPINIGSFTSIARGVQIQEYNHKVKSLSTFTFNYKVFERERKSDYLSKGRIDIGHDVWIGMQAIILSGVRVGNGAIVAAGSVVVSDVPDFAIVAGNPAKVIKYRFDQSLIDNINEMSWWNWPIEKIRSNSHIFDDINKMD